MLAPAEEMVKKFKKYLIPALKKPAPICAMILDPCIKTTHFKNNWKFLSDELEVHMTPDACVSIFRTEALHFDKSDNVAPISSTLKKIIKSKIEQSIFAPKLATRTLASEIQQYLTETTEDQSVDILKYWLSREKTFPSLAEMARCFLAIPATSASSEQVFSTSKAIIGPQRANLDSTSIEQLLCLKEWARVFCKTPPPNPHESVEIINRDNFNRLNQCCCFYFFILL